MRHLRAALPAAVTALVVALIASFVALAGAGPATSAAAGSAPQRPGTDLLAGSYQAEFARLSVAGKPTISSRRSPAISGKARVGRTVTVSSGAWKPAKVKVGYRWYVGTKKVKGAKAATYSPTADDAGQVLSVLVTATKKGYRSAAVLESAGTVKGGKIVSTSKPVLKGKAVVGKKLKATAGDWSVAGVELGYSWLQGKKELSTARKYRVRPSDAGKRLKVVVTAGKPGFRSASVRVRTDRIQAG
ncbi:hypothetical protein [Nocardioides sp.]|uniref:hypothetical protein n=2 Tax=Nocardioides sp. TaxID=35761 RepID=UPI000C8BD66D|nr:hypothetical protein [Pimelobacter sp.]